MVLTLKKETDEKNTKSLAVGKIHHTEDIVSNDTNNHLMIR